MSQLIHPLSVLDTVLDIKDSIDFAVLKSGQQIRSQRYQANSQSSNSLVYAIQVPSTNTVVSRNLIIGADITFNLRGTVPAYQYLWNDKPINQTQGANNYQSADCFAPFVMHQLMNTATVQINNTSVVQNQVNVILDPILRGLKHSDMQSLYGSTPTQLDYYGSYVNALPENEVLGAPLGATIVANKRSDATWNSPFNCAQNQNCRDLESRASFEIVSIDGNTPAGGAAAVKNVAVTVRIREPVILSPFLFNGNTDESGLVGITQMNFTFSLDSLATRAIRWLTTCPDKQVLNFTFNNSAYMELMYYTPHPTTLIPATCITPLQNFVNFQAQAQAVLNNGASFLFESPSLQLNSIPDKVIVWVDDTNKYVAGAGNSVPDHYASITNVNVTVANQTGLLSTFSQKQLYEASRKSGSQQTWDEFSGLVNGGTSDPAGNVTNNLGTCGSCLMLNFGDVISIADVYNAPASLQTTQFLINVTATNNTGLAITPRLNVMFLYSGILSTTNGNSASYINGVLTREDVLNASVAPHMAKKELTRYVGSGVLSDLKAMAKNVLPMVGKYGKNALMDVVADKVCKKSGGVMSAGAMASGRLSSKLV